LAFAVTGVVAAFAEHLPICYRSFTALLQPSCLASPALAPRDCASSQERRQKNGGARTGYVPLFKHQGENEATGWRHHSVCTGKTAASFP
jgi:hypothetical protein